MSIQASRRRDGPVVIDIQALQSPTTRGRGIARYARSLAIALEAHDPDLVGSYLLNPHLPPPGDIGALVESGKVTYAGSPGSIGPAAQLFHVLSPLDVDLRLGEVWPTEASARGLLSSATLYDFIPALDPDRELADRGRRRRYRLLLEVLRNLDGLQTLSTATTDLVGPILGSHPTVRNVGVAPDAVFRPAEEERSAASRAVDSLASVGLTASFVLCPSGSHPRKNNERLITAWAAVRPELRAGRQLVITGELDEPTKHHYATLASAGGAGGSVVTPGVVTDDTLVRLHQGADLVCYPTLAEGSPLPVAEAFACGAAVIASDRPPLDELVSPSGRFDPTDTAAMTRALEHALGDTTFCSSLTQPARPIDRWADVAARSAAAFDEQLARQRPRRAPPLRRSRPRIAFVSPLPPAPSGVASYSFALIEAIADTEKVDLDVYRDGPTEGQVAPRGLEVRSVAALGAAESLLGTYDHVIYAFGNSHHHLGALAALRRRSGTVLAHDVRLSNLYRHESGARGLPPGGLKRAIATMYDGSLPEDLGDNGELSAAELERFGVLMAREVISLSEHFFVSSDVAAALGRLDARRELSSRVAVLPFAVAAPSRLAEFAEEHRPAPDGIDPRIGRDWGKSPDGSQHPLVAHFGIVDPIKVPELVLESHALLRSSVPDAELVFVGPIADDLARSLSARAVALGIADAVSFTGPLPAAIYARWFDRATVAIQLRASTNGEASAAIGECLASGVPTVVNRIGWSASLPEDAVAKLEHPSSADALATVTALVLSDPRVQQMLRSASLRYAAEHSFDRTARSLLGLLLRTPLAALASS